MTRVEEERRRSGSSRLGCSGVRRCAYGLASRWLELMRCLQMDYPNDRDVLEMFECEHLIVNTCGRLPSVREPS